MWSVQCDRKDAHALGERSGEGGAAEGGDGHGHGDGGQSDEETETPDTLLRDSISCYRRALQMAQDNR